jgi:hypothetical protein
VEYFVVTLRPRRLLCAVLGATLVCSAVTLPAVANTSPAMTLSVTSGPAGMPLTVSGRNFRANSAGNVNFGSISTTSFMTDQAGSFKATILVPSVAAHAFAVTSKVKNNSVSSPFAVTTTTTTTTTSTTTAPAPVSAVVVADSFTRGDGLVTNEFAYWNPTHRAAVTDAMWQMGSGSLFVRDGAGWTGIPDNKAPSATSSAETNSAVFRLLTNRADLADVAVSFRLRHEGFVTTSTTPAVGWDGVHVFVRHADEENLYYVSVNRRDNTLAIKKKVSGGTSNGGSYHTLATGRRTVRVGVWEDITATAVTNANGSVILEGFINGTRVVSAADSGTGGPVIRSGRSGIRGDNSQFSFDDFVVHAR